MLILRDIVRLESHSSFAMEMTMPAEALSSASPEPQDNRDIETLGLPGGTMMQLWSIGVARVSDLATYNTETLRKKLADSLGGSAEARGRIEKVMADLQTVIRVQPAPLKEVPKEKAKESKDEQEESDDSPRRKDRLELEEVSDEVIEKSNASAPEFQNDTLAVLYRDMRKYKLLSSAEHTELGRKVLEQQDMEARNLLVSHNLRLVLSVARKQLWVTIARKKEWSALELADLVQEGTLGLMIAADRWDYRKGFAFSTYATWWIRQSISRAVQDSGFVRVPVHIQDALSKVRRVMNEIAAQTGRPPTLAEIAKGAEMTTGKIRSVLKATQMSYVSFDAKVNSGSSDMEEESSLAEFIPDDRFLTPDKALEAKQELDAACGRINTLTEVLYDDDTISDRNREIFVRFYGLEGSLQKRTLEHIGEKYNLTRERIRQMIGIVWEKLQQTGLDMDHDSVLADLARIGDLEKIANRRVSVD